MLNPAHRRLAVGLASLATLICAPAGQAQAQNQNQRNLVRIDASAITPPPQPVAAQLGSNRNPQGEVIGVNSQYLTRDGKPWLPVMGEFHYSRYPAERWEEEILKMKAAGVEIVSTYIIWLHHEQEQGHFDWTGQRDLRRFTELCAKHGMYVYPRIGPWAHAEVRHGGLPDWVMAQGPVRENNPRYLAAVDTFYRQIGLQLKGELWKDGGPVIGIQIENEYNASGPGKGVEHIRTLKQMALKAGFDVPLYTVTGWDGTAIPLDQVLPVFGGYPDAPWDGTPHQLPPNEIYAFRFDNRAAGSMGAIGGHGQNAASTYRGTPFLTAEVGDGIEDTYFRRPVVSADDIASIIPVMLGSGVNLLGYYMFHGGRNPDAEGITLQESQRTGYPTDVPVKSYDFQAPLGEFGQERPSLRKLKLVHYFLADFGSSLAPMQPHHPDLLPASPTDLTVPRVAARTLGDQGFIFFNNHVRGAAMPTRNAFQVELKLPAGTMRIPAEPIALPADSYGIWPVNLPLGAQTLRWSTAQLFKRVLVHGKPCFFFFTIPGLPAQFAFDAATPLPQPSTGFHKSESSTGSVLTASGEGSFTLADGTRVILLSEPQAEDVWRGDADPDTLLSTSADAFADHAQWTLDSLGDPIFRFGTFGSALAQVQSPRPESSAAEPGESSLFEWFRGSVAPLNLQPQIHQTASAGTRPPLELSPKLSWRPAQIPFAPDDKDFATAANWSIGIPPLPASASGVADLFLRVRYQGDAARLYRGGSLLDDSFWNGLPWEIGLRETLPAWPATGTELNLRVLPLPANAPMYLERLAPALPPVPARLESVTLIPEYRLELRTKPQQ